MASQDLNWLARDAVRHSDLETMMWYSYYILSECMTPEEREPLKEMVTNIVSAAFRYGYSDQKIYDLTLSSFVLIMDLVHNKFAPDSQTFQVYSIQFRDCLQALMDNDLIDANPMVLLIEDPEYMGKYFK